MYLHQRCVGPTVMTLAVLCLGGTARADVITQTFTQASDPVPETYMFAANQFNPTAGTLTSVDISVTSNVTASMNISSGNPNDDEFFTDATASVLVTLTGPGGLSLEVMATTPGQSGVVPAGDTFEPVSASVTASLATAFMSPGDLAPYIGTGTDVLPFTFGAGSDTYSVSPTFSIFGISFADASVTITYNFIPTPVPEPASYALLGLGGVVAMISRRSIRRVREQLS
jgi:hypothetical protein